MRTRLLATIIISIVALLGVVTTPDINLWSNADYGQASVYHTIFTIISVIGLVALIVGIISQRKEDDELFYNSIFIAGLAFISAALLLYFFGSDYEFAYYYLIVVSGGASFVLALDTKFGDIKVTIAMTSALVGVLSFLILPVITTIIGSGIFGDIAVETETSYNLLFHIGEQDTFVILYLITAIAGIISVVTGIISQARANDDIFEDSLISAGILTIAATTLFAAYFGFNTEYLGSAIYLIFISGVGYLTTGVLSKKGSL